MGVIEHRKESLCRLIDDRYLGYHLYADGADRERIIEAVRPCDSEYRRRSWPTVKSWAKELGYEVRDGRDSRSRYTQFFGTSRTRERKARRLWPDYDEIRAWELERLAESLHSHTREMRI